MKRIYNAAPGWLIFRMGTRRYCAIGSPWTYGMIEDDPESVIEVRFVSRLRYEHGRHWAYAAATDLISEHRLTYPTFSEATRKFRLARTQPESVLMRGMLA